MAILPSPAFFFAPFLQLKNDQFAHLHAQRSCACKCGKSQNVETREEIEKSFPKPAFFFRGFYSTERDRFISPMKRLEAGSSRHLVSFEVYIGSWWGQKQRTVVFQLCRSCQLLPALSGLNSTDTAQKFAVKAKTDVRERVYSPPNAQKSNEEQGNANTVF